MLLKEHVWSNGGSGVAQGEPTHAQGGTLHTEQP